MSTVPYVISLDVSMMENMRDGFFGLDEKWRIQYANRVAKAYLAGWEETTDLDIWSLFPSLTTTIFYDELMNVSKNRLPTQFEMLGPNSNKWLSIRVYPSTGGIVIFFHDITGQRAAKQHLERLNKFSLISQIATGVAHEIRNPLTVVKGYLQFLKRKYEADTTKFMLALTEIKTIEDLISKFLYVAQNKRSEQSSVNINTIIEQQLKPVILAKAAEKFIVIDYLLDELPETLVCPEEITQLLLQLLNNAMDASRDRATVILRTSVENRNIVIQVIDKGKGISSEDIEKIFDPFFSTKDDRVGLGLAMCASIAERHSGKIEVSSIVDEGTTFTVKLPILFSPMPLPLL